MSILPVPGDLVRVRGGAHVVTAVSGHPPQADASGRSGARATLVSLTSVMEDHLGEELEVIWELEAGVEIREQMDLPQPGGFDSPHHQEAFLNAVRWGASSNAYFDHVQSPFRAGVRPEDYQLDPVVRAIRMPRTSLLIADDVGLGKTIEAGLVIQELLLRHRARRVLILCPAPLQIQWRDQMRDKFGLEFRIVDSAAMKQLRRERGMNVDPWTHYPRLITSIDYIKREGPLRLLKQGLSTSGGRPRAVDMLVIDEAHAVAPSGGGRYALDSLRTHAVRQLAPHCEHKLFLTATPHNGYPESFSALLELLDHQRFARGVQPDPVQLAAVMVRRLKSDLVDDLGNPRFPGRQLTPMEVCWDQEERAAHQALTDYTHERLARAADDGLEYTVKFVCKLLKKRLFSSPKAFAGTVEKHFEAVTRTREMSAPRTTNMRLIRRQLDPFEENDGDDDAQYDQELTACLANAAQSEPPLTQEAVNLLHALKAWGKQAAAGPDSKARVLLRWLKDTLKPGGSWNDERVVIFTEYRDTLNWLHGILVQEGYGRNNRMALIYGGMPLEEREAVKAAFQAGPEESPVRILLATDAASEGIDLQNYCHRLIHYEIPWNPNRMEQRNGRIDRHGQRFQPQIFHFVGAGYQADRDPRDLRPGDLDGDLEFLMHAARKVETIREDLGKVGPVIADQVQLAMRGERRGIETSHHERDAKKDRKILRVERDLRERIKTLNAKYHQTRVDLSLTPDKVQQVVTVGLALAGQRPLEAMVVKGRDGRPDLDAWRLCELSGSWSRCTDGLNHPHTGQPRPVVFDESLIVGRDDVVLVHLNHRLTQMCMRLLRAEVWSGQQTGRLHRVAARIVPDRDFPERAEPVILAHARLVVIGGCRERLHEELITAGGRFVEGRFNLIRTEKEKKQFADLMGVNVAAEALHPRLNQLYQANGDRLKRGLEARRDQRADAVIKKLMERRDQECADLGRIMDELAQSIRNVLHQPQNQQLELFDEDERHQFDIDLRGLEQRLGGLEGEKQRELQAVRDRYANPTPRLFPVAVTWIIPQSLAEKEARHG